MAPLPQPSDTASSTSSEPQPSAALPGMKRGIAVGVAASVSLILIALLAFFAIRRRRKQREAQQQQVLAPDAELPPLPTEKNARLPPEKKWMVIPPSSPVEADAQHIYELDAGQDAGQMPELPTRVHVPVAQELGAEHAGDRLSAASQARGEADELRESRCSEVPTLHVSAPELSPLNSRNSLPFGVSSLAVSPLEDSYFPKSSRSPRSS